MGPGVPVSGGYGSITFKAIMAPRPPAPGMHSTPQHSSPLFYFVFPRLPGFFWLPGQRRRPTIIRRYEKFIIARPLPLPLPNLPSPQGPLRKPLAPPQAFPSLPCLPGTTAPDLPASLTRSTRWQCTRSTKLSSTLSHRVPNSSSTTINPTQPSSCQLGSLHTMREGDEARPWAVLCRPAGISAKAIYFVLPSPIRCISVSSMFALLALPCQRPPSDRFPLHRP